MSLTDTFFRSRPERDAVGLRLLELWRSIANGFRADEQSVEAAHFAELGAPISVELAALKPGQVPDLGLMQRMLTVLGPEIAERIGDLHARIDDLADNCRTRDRELTMQQLAASWQSDELERCRTMLVDQLRGRETVLPGPGPDGAAPLVSQLLAALLHVSAPPPRPEAHGGRRTTEAPAAPAEAADSDGDATADDSERAVILRALREVLDGTAQTPRLVRALDDQVLARRLADLAAEHRSYKAILQRIGVLPRE